jgi:hypothetical protein
VAAAAGSAAGKLSGHVAIITGSGNGIGATQSVGVCLSIHCDCSMRHCARSHSPKRCDSCTLFHCTSLIPNFTLSLQIKFSSLPLSLIRHFLPSRPHPALLLSHRTGEACAKKYGGPERRWR